MCGFITTISKKNTVFPQDSLRRMASIISHRGPDDSGFFFSESLSLAFRRLKIIDLSEKGHQPMFSQDGRYVIVFNGEIYNYMEIREELKKKGIVFNSDSDTEVLLNSYIQWGEKCLHKFIGMFAFAIYDQTEKSVFFARDQLGIKPLFIFENAEYVILTSEIKAILPFSQLEPDFSTFNEYLIFRSLPGERTMFKNVRSLPAGHFGRWNNGILSKHSYFKLEETFDQDANLTFAAACEKTDTVLKESIQLHLRSDVELGVQLSGGIDSSLITAIASKLTGRRLHSFSISFSEDEYDESEYQKRVSLKYNTEHHDFRMDEDIFTTNIERALWHYEHPLNDPNSVATYYLAKKAKDFVTVMLSGEGADESFLGYVKFLPETIQRLKLRTMIHHRKRLRSIISKIWPFQKGRALLSATKYPPAMFALSYAKLNLIDELLGGNYSEMIPRSLISGLAHGNILSEAILQDEICDLPQWFWRADRMGMGASLEFRVPFCTEKMFKTANSIPYKLKVYQGERKAILKKIAEKYIEQDQIYRKKIGFGTPIDKWICKKGKYHELFEDTINSVSFKDRSFINQNHFSKIYKAHRNGVYTEHNSAFLWTYFNLELWSRIFFDGKWKNFTN
ncbi:MAG TPA: asparagine synthase (glutamine-hydrolyzing) [Victivallales bacterium]|nr:asparagine synthase (glutamine-hydrolyzing) [Victivallales bacterium]